MGDEEGQRGKGSGRSGVGVGKGGGGGAEGKCLGLGVKEISFLALVSNCCINQ